jgi:hypothetical protein
MPFGVDNDPVIERVARTPGKAPTTSRCIFDYILVPEQTKPAI